MQGLNEQLKSTSESLAFIVPELVLSTAILALLTAGLISRNRYLLFNLITVAAAIFSIYLVANGGMKLEIKLFNNLMHRSGLGDFLILLIDVSLILTCLMSISVRMQNTSEYYALLLSIALGAHLLVMSTSMVMIFLALEVISVSSYVLAGYAFNRAGSEGSLKYFLFGAIASAVMIYGFSLLYGFTGTMDITSEQFFQGLVGQASPLVLVGGIMALCGFLFKMAAVPMQPWAPDVYQAAPLPVIALLSVAPKVAALGITVKFIVAMHVFGQGHFDWQLVVCAVSILTITVGNFSALWQKDAKRMMAYSSIAQTGFLLVGIAAFLPQGIQFMLFYSAVYLLMNYSVFIYLKYFEDRGMTTMPSFSGAGKMHVAAAAGLTLALVSLAGLPPTGGFTAKLLIFSGLWEAYQETNKTLLIWLLIFGLLNTVVSLFYYVRIPYYAFIKAGSVESAEKTRGIENFLGLILVLLIVAVFFIPGLLMGLINRINFVL